LFFNWDKYRFSQYTCANKSQMKAVSHLEIFVNIVELGSFSAVARQFFTVLPVNKV